MKKVFSCILLAFAPYALAIDWLIVESTFDNGSSTVYYIEYDVAYLEANRNKDVKLLWTKSTFNINGYNSTFFMYTAIDCPRKMWRSLRAESWKNGQFEKQKTEPGPLNLFDFSTKKDSVTYNLICKL